MGIAAGLGKDEPCRRFGGSVPARSAQALVRTAAAETLADKVPVERRLRPPQELP